MWLSGFYPGVGGEIERKKTLEKSKKRAQKDRAKQKRRRKRMGVRPQSRKDPLWKIGTKKPNIVGKRKK